MAPKRTADFIVSIAIGLSATGNWAAQGGFDCAKATHDAEKLACKDAGLAELDQSLVELYATLLKHTAAAKKGMLKAEQRGWVKGLNDFRKPFPGANAAGVVRCGSPHAPYRHSGSSTEPHAA